MRAVTYRRVSTTEQAESGLGLDAQAITITAALGARGWVPVAELVDEGVSGKNLNRPALQAALAMLDAGDADVLVVAKLDRLSRSVLDFAGLLQRASARGWRIVALDVGVDTSTPSGELMSTVVSAFSQYERRLIAARTKDALGALKAQGVRLGRPVALPAETRARISQMRAGGMSLPKIAAALTDDGVPTAQGGARWYPSTVAKVLKSIQADKVAVA